VRYLHLTGTVDARGRFSAGWWSTVPAELGSAPATDDASAEWEAVALDQADEVRSRSTALLAAQPICPGGIQWRFEAVLPVPDDAASVAVRTSGTEVQRRPVLPPAAVRLNVGASRQLARKPTTVDVQIDGPPPGPGAYLVASWVPLGEAPISLGLVPVAAEAPLGFPLDLETLPGGDGCRLVVNYFDGINQTTASVDGLSLERRAAVPVISSPDPGALVFSTAWLCLVGQLEGDGDPDALEWFIDGRPVGTGPSVGVNELPLGTRTIALRYGAAEVTAEVTVHPVPVDEVVPLAWEPPWRSSRSARGTYT
jgi:hypothetical protein